MAIDKPTAIVVGSVVIAAAIITTAIVAKELSMSSVPPGVPVQQAQQTNSDSQLRPGAVSTRDGAYDILVDLEPGLASADRSAVFAMFDSVCSDLDAGRGVGEVGVPSSLSGTEGQSVVLLAVASTCPDYVSAVDEYFA